MSRDKATELAFYCISEDPRWDSQVESRSGYYAELLRDLEVDPLRLGPTNFHEKYPTSDQALAVDVVGRLVILGVDGAAEVLLDHVAAGVEWDSAIFHTSRAPEKLYGRLKVGSRFG